MLRNSFLFLFLTAFALLPSLLAAQEKETAKSPAPAEDAPEKGPAKSPPPAEDAPESKEKSDRQKADEAFDAVREGADVEIEGALLDPATVEALTESIQPAIVKIVHLSRDGPPLGTGSGFIIDKKGLIATNQHVIGTARPIKVELFDGTEFDVTEVHAFDRRLDLAILKIDPKKKKLTALPIAAPDELSQGQPILGFGNPEGLKFSVVSGLVSAIRELEDNFYIDGGIPDFPMIQIAMPIEMGNSGGPIVDLHGHVHGIVTIKHMRTPNLGFAVPVEHLQPLLDKPNPVPMSRWVTIGALDPDFWTVVMGARWTQRGGMITGEGTGGGFGGRALCLSERKVPGRPYEVAVRVKLDDESGAAGLVFASDGDDKHYGFYPSGGRIRLTRFEGEDVYTWTILQQIDTDAYKPGEWNHLRVRVTDDKIVGFINDEKVLEMDDGVLRGGKVGLCKFRGTTAEYRNFKVGKDLIGAPASADVIARLNKQIDTFAATGKGDNELVGNLAAEAASSRVLLLDRATELEAKAAAMRRLNSDLHLHHIGRKISETLDKPDDEIDLFASALWISQLDEPELDYDFYLEQFDQLTAEARESIGEEELTDRARAAALSRFLFEESGFHGSRSEYYHPANSYLNEVLDYREGLPITLSVVFVELARRLGIKGVHGVPLPGHFLVGHFDDSAKKKHEELQLIDVFEGGKLISRKEAEDISWSIAQVFPSDESFEPSTPKEIVVRMLRNLIGIEMQERRPESARNYIELVLMLAPDETQERFQRAILRYQDNDPAGAAEDIDWLLDRRPEGLDYGRLGAFREQLEREMAGDESPE